MNSNDSITVAVTGASGSVYADRLICVLSEMGFWIDLIVSDSGRKVIAHELGITDVEEHFAGSANITCHDNRDIAASIASGTSTAKRMVVIPASMGTTARIAAGISSCLVERAADVVIKERGNLVLVPRESPMSPIHLQNLLTLSRIGVTIVPAAPGFYHKPRSIDDLVDFIVTKTLDVLGIKSDLIKRWPASVTLDQI